MRLDKPESLECAALLLRGGAEPIDAVDLAGEGLLHRAVRYGASDFIRLWFRCGGNMGIKCSTKDENDACDVPTCISIDPVLKSLDARIHAQKLGEEEVDFIDQEVEVLEVRADFTTTLNQGQRLYRSKYAFSCSLHEQSLLMMVPAGAC
eukprot:1141193-Pelagomonas_calceolata.AAC.3